jgi:hypothetical protein
MFHSGRPLGLLRIGYLSLFRLLEYRYIGAPAAFVIRELITFQNCGALNVCKFTGTIGGDTARFSESIQHLRIAGDKAIMVAIRLTTQVERVYAAFLPSPELAADEVVPALRAAAISLDRRGPK